MQLQAPPACKIPSRQYHTADPVPASFGISSLAEQLHVMGLTEAHTALYRPAHIQAARGAMGMETGGVSWDSMAYLEEMDSTSPHSEPKDWYSPGPSSKSASSSESDRPWRSRRPWIRPCQSSLPWLREKASLQTGNLPGAQSNTGFAAPSTSSPDVTWPASASQDRESCLAIIPCITEAPSGHEQHLPFAGRPQKLLLSFKLPSQVVVLPLYAQQFLSCVSKYEDQGFRLQDCCFFV